MTLMSLWKHSHPPPCISSTLISCPLTRKDRKTHLPLWYTSNSMPSGLRWLPPATNCFTGTTWNLLLLKVAFSNSSLGFLKVCNTNIPNSLVESIKFDRYNWNVSYFHTNKVILQRLCADYPSKFWGTAQVEDKNKVAGLKIINLKVMSLRNNRAKTKHSTWEMHLGLQLIPLLFTSTETISVRVWEPLLVFFYTFFLIQTRNWYWQKSAIELVQP